MPVILTRGDIQGLNWVQVNALCRFLGISYYAKGSKLKDTAKKKDELWLQLKEESETMRSIPKHVCRARK